MGTVIQFRRPVASAEVIANLVKLGYLQPAKRYEANALEAAVARLRHDLSRNSVICEGDLVTTHPLIDLAVRSRSVAPALNTPALPQHEGT
jgi:hypothetical protein